MNKNIDIGFMGECYVLYKLSTLGVKGENLKDIFDFDLMLDNNCKIEVKTSSIGIGKKNKNNKEYVWERWQFHNHYFDNKTKKTSKRKRTCDFYVFIGLNEEEKIDSVFIIPENEITDSQTITIPTHNKEYNKYNKINRYFKYKNNWDLIVDNYFKK